MYGRTLYSGFVLIDRICTFSTLYSLGRFSTHEQLSGRKTDMTYDVLLRKTTSQ